MLLSFYSFVSIDFSSTIAFLCKVSTSTKVFLKFSRTIP